MLRIAICDDMPNELQGLVLLTSQYISTHNLDAEITEFSHSDALLTAMEVQSYHLYILDIVMPMVNGLELGKVIRRLDRESQIIFATTEPQFALQAYAAAPINYLIKPVEKQPFFDTLALAISKADFVEEKTFAIKTSGSMRVIKLSDILFLEYGNHSVLFHLVNGEDVLSRTIRVSFSEYSAPILRDRHFMQCHTSFVVNLRRVEQFSKDGFMLHGGKTVPIAAKQYPAVRDAYMDYLMAKGEQR